MDISNNFLKQLTGEDLKDEQWEKMSVLVNKYGHKELVLGDAEDIADFLDIYLVQVFTEDVERDFEYSKSYPENLDPWYNFYHDYIKDASIMELRFDFPKKEYKDRWNALRDEYREIFW